MCFPAEAGAGVETVRRRGIVLWTDAAIDGRKLLAEVLAAKGFLEGLLPPGRPASGSAPATRPADRPVALAVYARRRQYLALWRRVGAYYGGSFAPVATEGYSYRVFCATYYDTAEAFAARPPVLCHEFAHVWLYQRHGLRNDGNWLTEGIANAVQLRFFPDSANRRDFARWLAEGRMLPLKRLMDMERIAVKDYWQAATLAELLMLRYRRQLPAVIAAFNSGKSAYAIVTGALGTDFPALQKQWAEHVRAGAKSQDKSSREP